MIVHETEMDMEMEMEMEIQRFIIAEMAAAAAAMEIAP